MSASSSSRLPGMRHPPDCASGNFIVISVIIHGPFLSTLSLHVPQHAGTMAPTVMPNSETQDSTDPHSSAGNATHALVTFWASLALLGASVAFLLVYSAFKMFRNGGHQKITHEEDKRVATKHRCSRQVSQRTGTATRPFVWGFNRFGRARHGAVKEVRTNISCVTVC